MWNQLKTILLFGVLSALFVAIGGAVAPHHLGVFLILAVAMNLGAYFFSDKLVLAMYRARELSEQEAPELHAIVRELATRAGLPMPRLFLVPGVQANAFATGRNPAHAVVAVTEGLMGALDRREIRGVLAHELAHVKNRDMLTSTVAAGIAGAISYVPYLLMFGGGRDDRDRNPVVELALILLAPIAAMLLQFAVSRQREFAADRTGAEILGRPLPLANALRRLDALAHRIPMQVAPAAAPLAQVNPLAAYDGGMARLFSTHPPTAERVARLEAMAAAR
jgi:heat shock protein HtpX